MTTSLDLSTDVFPINSEISGGNLVSNGGLGLQHMDFLLKAPELTSGGTFTIHLTGTFRPESVTFYSLLSADIDGYNDSNYYDLHNSVVGGVTATQTYDVTIATGIEDYDGAVDAGETFMYVTLSGSTTVSPVITAITYDGVSGGDGGGGPTTGSFTDDIPATILSSDDGVFLTYGANPIQDPGTDSYIPVTESHLHTDSYVPGYVYVQYGGGDRRFNWTLPEGATLVSMQYVARAYREADVAPEGAPSGWTPPPAANPFLSLEAADSGVKLAMPELVVTTSWADAPDELLIDVPDMAAVYDDDLVQDRLTSVQWSTVSSAVIQCAYLAVRVTYDIPDVDATGDPNPVRRRFY